MQRSGMRTVVDLVFCGVVCVITGACQTLRSPVDAAPQAAATTKDPGAPCAVWGLIQGIQVVLSVDQT